MPDPATPQPAATPATKGAVFLRRLVSFVILWSVVLGALFSGSRLVSDGLFLVIILLLAGLGLMEFYDMVAKRGLVCFRGWGVFGGLLLMGSTFVYLNGPLGVDATVAPAKASDFESAILVIFVLGLCLRQFVSKSNTAGLEAIALTLLGLMYVPWLLNFIQKINYFPRADGTLYLLYFILVTKFSDVGAYCTGSLIGRHKMIPRISPGKTWEGFAGAVVISTGASVMFAHLAGPRLTGMTLTHAVILGVILSIGAVIGDLIESLFKRESGVKDSGRYLPGIGGILDLLDSLLFNAPLMYLYLRHVLTH
jgi:phosphatidate cytidylyltransferase